MIKICLLVLGVAFASLCAPDLHATIPPTVYAAIPVAAIAANVEPIFVSVAMAAEILATSRSQIYQRLARGELHAVKDGSRTKVTYESIKHAATALPKATVKLYVPRAQRAAVLASKNPPKA